MKAGIPGRVSLPYYKRAKPFPEAFPANVSLCLIGQNRVTCPSVNQSMSMENGITMLALAAGEGIPSLNTLLTSKFLNIDLKKRNSCLVDNNRENKNPQDSFTS